jgi:hypothetical protein
MKITANGIHIEVEDSGGEGRPLHFPGRRGSSCNGSSVVVDHYQMGPFIQSAEKCP